MDSYNTVGINYSQKSLDKQSLIRYKEQLYTESKLLVNHGFKHGFFSKTSTDKDPSSLIKINIETLAIHQLNQVHSNKIVEVSKKLSSHLPKADAMISRQPNQSLWIYTADCIPILFADKSKRIVSACHAGMKGLKKDILRHIILKLAFLGCRTEDILIAMGPAISGSKYQVREEDGNQIIATLHKNDLYRKSGNRDKAGKILSDSYPFIQKDISPEKILLDIRLAASTRLIQLGINPNQIDINKYCTFSNPRLFNSWRREHKKAFQWSFIAS